MMKLIISAAAVTAIVGFVTVPASAEYIGGGPRVNGEGKCWKDTGGLRDARYGTWVECPKQATVADSTCRLGQLQWEKLHVGMQYFDVCGHDGGGKPTTVAARPAPKSSR
jgi:hypothetical protein